MIMIQETKLHKHESTTYIDKWIQDYEVLYNNANNNPAQIQSPYAPYTPFRIGILTMIHKSIYSNENNTKIPKSS